MPVSEESRFFNIVKDYVGYKLRQNGINIAGYHENGSPSKVSVDLRRVADELTAANRELFDSMCDQLHLTQNSAYPTFVGIADEVFQNGKNWGRIVAFLAFGANVAVHCAQRQDLQGSVRVENVVQWIVMYMEEHLSKWIDENGGWVSTLKF